MKRVAVVVACVGLVGLFSYPLVVYAIRTSEARKRRVATIDELTAHVQSSRQRDSVANRTRANRFQTTIAYLRDENLPALTTPKLFSSHIYQPSEGNPYLEVYWIEESRTVDGIDLYIDREFAGTLTGWSREIETDPEITDDLFGNRYDRFKVVDFVFDSSIPILKNWQLPIESDVLSGRVEIQLRTSEPIGQRLLASNELSDEPSDARKSASRGDSALED